MCGIAAFSLTEGSKINARALSHSLLKMIENRGGHASGYAWTDRSGNSGVYKGPVPGSQLTLGTMPRRANTVILHTRYATQGDPQINTNNHPVVSTDNLIAAVHNGVISNDWELRDGLGLTKADGTVDSLVIPNLIAQRGVKSLSEMSGYAAISWLDQDDPGVLNIAKLKTSPVAYTWLEDGSFVMASTVPLLRAALATAGLEFGGIFDLAEGRMIQVINGIIWDHSAAPYMKYDHHSYSRHSNATSGGHATSGNQKPPATIHPVRALVAPPALEPVDDTVTDETVAGYLADLEEWRRKSEERDKQTTNGKSEVVFGTPPDDQEPMALGTPEEALACTTQDEADEQDEFNVRFLTGWETAPGPDDEFGFYLVDTDGSMEAFPTVEDLEARLRWLSRMTKDPMGDMFEVSDNLNWVNHVWDIGHIEGDTVLISWVDEQEQANDWKVEPDELDMGTGLSLLGQLKGA